MARRAAIGRPVLIGDAADGGDNNNDANTLLELSFSNIRFVESVIESMQFMPMETRRQKSRLLLRSPAPRIQPANQTTDMELLTELLTELQTFPLTSINIDELAFELPGRPFASLVRRTASTLQHFTLSKFSFSCFDDAAFEELCTAARGLSNLQTFALNEPQTADPRNGWGALRNHCARLIRCVAPQVRSLSLDITNAMEELKHSLIADRLYRGGDNTHLEAVYGREMAFTTGLGAVLETTNKMESLSLALCDLRSLVPIANALKQNRSIKTLECRLSVCALNAPSELVQAVHEMIRDNYILQRIHVVSGSRRAGSRRDTEFAELSSVDDPLIALYLKLNGVGRYHLLESGQATRKEWIETIIDNRDDTKVVQYFLSKNPSLCVAV